MIFRVLRIVLPLALFAGLIYFWQWAVTAWHIPKYILPSPLQIYDSFKTDGLSLAGSAWITLETTLMAFTLAVVSGVALAVVFATSRIAEAALSPYAVTLQVTPVVAIAPLIIVWTGTDNVWLAVLTLAWIVAFFPVLANATAGFKAVDPNLRDLFRLYRAGPLTRLRRLLLPSALPYLLTGFKTAGGLALVGSVVAEFAASSGNSQGLAWRIAAAGHQLRADKMFAALIILAVMGLAIYALLSALEWLLLHRWHGPQER